MNPARFSLSHSPLIGWGLAVAAIAIGYMQYGWPGVFLAFTVIVFWLLLQFSRALRVMRAAATNPVASVDSALMAQTRIHPGIRCCRCCAKPAAWANGCHIPAPGPTRAGSGVTGAGTPWWWTSPRGAVWGPISCARPPRKQATGQPMV